MTTRRQPAPGVPIMAAVEQVAARRPDRPALVHRDQPISYGDLVRRVRALAAQFAREGLGPGVGAGIALRDELGNILVALALLRLGCRQVALPPRDPAPLREDLARRLRLAAVIGEEGADAPGGAALLVPDLEAARVVRAPDLPPPPGVAELVVGTSGTTGRPKLMAADEAMMVDRAAILAAHGRVFLHALGFDGNHGKRLTLRSLVTGGTEVLAGGAGPRELAALARRFGIARMHLQPQAAASLLAERGRGSAFPPGLRLFTTGTRIPQALRLELQAALGVAVHVQYGTTEAGMVSIAGPSDHGGHPDSVGRVLPGVEVSTVDDEGRALPPGAEGLLRFRSSGVVRGYLDDPAADARFFADGWFRPGDVGRVAPEGEVFVAGRRDEMMTLGVIKIFPSEIEAVAEGFPALRESAAFALPAGHLGEIPMLAVVADPGFDADALLALCRARLGVRAPRKVVQVAGLPRNGAGKVLRRDLPQLAGLVAR